MAGRSKENWIKSNYAGYRSFWTRALSCLLLLSLCLILISCGTPYGIYHTVGPGQTLYGISRTYGVSQEELLRINRIGKGEALRQGDKIFIPGADHEKEVSSSTASGGRISKVARNKTGIRTMQPAPKTASQDEKGRFIWPVKGDLISAFGLRDGEKHAGIDIKAPEGTPVKAAESGKVIYSGNGLSGYGNLIIIKHQGVFFTVYAHNRKNLVSEGALVEKGETISEVGDTGRATTAHLHFEVRKNKVTVDPILYLP